LEYVCRQNLNFLTCLSCQLADFFRRSFSPFPRVFLSCLFCRAVLVVSAVCAVSCPVLCCDVVCGVCACCGVPCLLWCMFPSLSLSSSPSVSRPVSFLPVFFLSARLCSLVLLRGGDCAGWFLQSGASFLRGCSLPQELPS